MRARGAPKSQAVTSGVFGAAPVAHQMLSEATQNAAVRVTSAEEAARLMRKNCMRQTTTVGSSSRTWYARSHGMRDTDGTVVLGIRQERFCSTSRGPNGYRAWGLVAGVAFHRARMCLDCND